MYFIFNPCTDPARNLAFEEYFLTRKQGDYTLLWRNRPTVVIGAHQCAAAEVRLDLLDKEGVALVRRISGGGAVYHDLGNVNFSFITDYGGGLDDFALLCKPVLDCLRQLGVKAEAGGRNDLLADGKKFSGTAKAVKNGRLLLHGTLLFDTDLTALERLLTPRIEKLESKGIKSVRSRVTNLRPLLPELDAESFSARLKEFFIASGAEPTEPEKEDTEQITALAEQKYRGRDWTLGKDPLCAAGKTLRCAAGTVSASRVTKGGIITDAQFTGDFFSRLGPEGLAAALVGASCDRAGITDALKGLFLGDFIENITLDAIVELLF